MQNSIKNPSVVISNTENMPFLLPIDIGQYGQYEHDELEIRVCNDFIEVSGKQAWRMAVGGADKRMFAHRHVLPDYIDLKAVYCRLKGNTILVNAPSLSFVSRLANNNQLKVDYSLGLDANGFQFLKRYNSITHTTQAIESQMSKHVKKLDSEINMANALFDMVKNQGKPSSKLFSSALSQRNTDVNNLKSNSLRSFSNYRKRLNVDQIMKDYKDESNQLIVRSKASTVRIDTKESSSQTTNKKPRKRKSKKKSSDQLTNSTLISNNGKLVGVLINKVSENDKLERDKIMKKIEDQADKSDTERFNLCEKSNASTISTDKRKTSESNDAQEKQNEESFCDLIADKKKDWIMIKRDDLVNKSIGCVDTNNLSNGERSDESVSSDSLEKSQELKENKSSVDTIKDIGKYISNFITNNNLISNHSNEADTSLTSCLKHASNEDKNESKNEKHVVIAESTQID